VQELVSVGQRQHTQPVAGQVSDRADLIETVADGWGINGHVGHLNFKNMSKADYTDWKLGVTKDIGGWVFGAAYVDTNANGSCGKGEFYCFLNSSGSGGKNAGKATAVISVTKTF